jgi:hypothetical protein
VSFPKELLPLFVEFQPPKIFAYHEQKSELQVYLSGKKEPETSLVLKKGAKLIQDGKFFGIVEQGSQPHQVMVRTIKGWSGDSFRSHALDLPKDWSFDNLRIDYDFGAEIALVSAADFKMRRGSVAPQFRKVLLFNKAKSTPIAELSLADDLYFGSVDLSADGKFIFSLVRSLEDDGAKVFKTWSVDDGKWLEDIALTRETVPEQTTKTKPKG